MAEYIEREKYVKLNDIIETLEYEWGYEGMREDLYNLPAADVVEVRHGEWIVEEEQKTTLSGSCVYKAKTYHCPYCKKHFKQQMKFCGECGAKMKGAEE